MEESDGKRSTGSDTAETEERAFRAMTIVTTLSYVRAVKAHARTYDNAPRCESACRSS